MPLPPGMPVSSGIYPWCCAFLGFGQVNDESSIVRACSVNRTLLSLFIPPLHLLRKIQLLGSQIHETLPNPKSSAMKLFASFSGFPLSSGPIITLRTSKNHCFINSSQAWSYVPEGRTVPVLLPSILKEGLSMGHHFCLSVTGLKRKKKQSIIHENKSPFTLKINLLPIKIPK